MGEVVVPKKVEGEIGAFNYMVLILKCQMATMTEGRTKVPLLREAPEQKDPTLAKRDGQIQKAAEGEEG